ncbi:MAG: permease [Candidatus Moraniibacteriota bacterium]
MEWFKKTTSGIKFLLGVIAVYAAVAFFNFELFLTGLEQTGLMFWRLIPILLLVLGVMFVVNKFIKTDRIKKHLGEESGWKGWIWAMITGILISGPPYVLFPLLQELKEKGMKNSLIAVFLYNRNVKIPFFPVMVYYFGLAFTIIISVYIIIFSVFSGWLMHYLCKDNCD